MTSRAHRSPALGEYPLPASTSIVRPDGASTTQHCPWPTSRKVTNIGSGRVALTANQIEAATAANSRAQAIRLGTSHSRQSRRARYAHAITASPPYHATQAGAVNRVHDT